MVYDAHVSAPPSDLRVELLVFRRLRRRGSGLRKTTIYGGEARHEDLFRRRLAIEAGRVFVPVFVAWLSAFDAELFSFEKIPYSAFARRNDVAVGISSSSTLSFGVLILIFVIPIALATATASSMVWALFIIELPGEETLDQSLKWGFVVNVLKAVGILIEKESFKEHFSVSVRHIIAGES